MPRARAVTAPAFAGWVKALIAAVLLLATFAGMVLAFDSTYAHASDIAKLSMQIRINRLASEVQTLELRRSTLQDKVYEGESRRSRGRADIEILDRYKRELADIDRSITVKQREIFEAGRK